MEIQNQTKRLNNAQAAKYLGLAPQTLNNFRCRRIGPDYIKIGRRVLYDTETLDLFLESSRVNLKR